MAQLIVPLLLVLCSVGLATLPGLAAWRSNATSRAAKLAVLASLPVLFGAAYVALSAVTTLGIAAGSGLAAAALLGACSLVVYRKTPEVDRFDRLVLALLCALLLSPTSIILLGLASLADSLGMAQLGVGAALVACVLGLPLVVILCYTRVLARVREPEPLQVRRIESSQRRLADIAAKQLMRDVLGEHATKQAGTRGYLEVEGKLCRYRVYPGSFRTAVLNKNGRWIGNLCAVPANSQPVPDYDQLVAKVLMLQHAEEEFWVVANLIDSGPEAWEIRDRLTGVVPAERRKRIEPAPCLD